MKVGEYNLALRNETAKMLKELRSKACYIKRGTTTVLVDESDTYSEISVRTMKEFLKDKDDNLSCSISDVHDPYDGFVTGICISLYKKIPLSDKKYYEEVLANYMSVFPKHTDDLVRKVREALNHSVGTYHVNKLIQLFEAEGYVKK